MSQKKYKIFLSSTYSDLKQFRSVAIKQLGQININCYPMENWTAEDKEPLSASLDKVVECNLMVLLVGFRLGFIPENESKSITQMEYEHAKKNNISVLVFLLDSNCTDWPTEFDDRLDEKKREAIIKWRDLLEKEKIRESFSSDPKSLNIVPAIYNWKNDFVGIRERIYNGSRNFYNFVKSPGGRFYNLIISDLLLTKFQLVQGENKMKEEVYFSSNDKRINELIVNQWNKNKQSIVILGEGGSGKTVSLIKLWENYLETYAQGEEVPIPIYIALNEINDVVDKSDFIMNYIINNYLNHQNMFREELIELFSTDCDNSIPKIVLLLDGYNEITVEKNLLNNDITKFFLRQKGVQLLITSRNDLIDAYLSDNFEKFHIQPLEIETVIKYLESHSIMVRNAAIFQVLKNPMMLTIYTATCQTLYELDEKGVETIISKGEILWYFLITQTRVFDRVYSREISSYYHFLVMHVLPFIGYTMQINGSFDINLEKLKSILSGFLQWIDKNYSDYLNAFPMYENYIEFFKLELNPKNEPRRLNEIISVLTGNLYLLVKEGDSYRFLHQYFRDFFAAKNIQNNIKYDLKNNEIPRLIKSNRIEDEVLQLLAEIEGEPQFWIDNDVTKPTFVNEIFNNCDKAIISNNNYTLQNCFSYYKFYRNNLCGLDMSKIDLSKIDFSKLGLWKIKFSSFFKNKLYSQNNFKETVFDSEGLTKYNYQSSKIPYIVGRFIIVIDWHVITIYDSKNNKIIYVDSSVNHGIFNEDIKVLAYFDTESTLQILDFGNKNQRTFNFPEKMADSVWGLFGFVGNDIIAIGNYGALNFINIYNGSVIKSLSIKPKASCFSNSVNKFFYITEDEIGVMSYPSLKIEKNLKFSGIDVEHCHCDCSGRFIILIGKYLKEGSQLWDLEQEKLINEFEPCQISYNGNPFSPTNSVISYFNVIQVKGELLEKVDTTTDLIQFDLINKKVLSRTYFPDYFRKLYCYYTSDGMTIITEAVGPENLGVVYEIEAASGQIVNIRTFEDSFHDLYVTLDPEYYFCSSYNVNDCIFRFRIGSPEPAEKLKLHEIYAVQGIVFSNTNLFTELDDKLKETFRNNFGLFNDTDIEEWNELIQYINTTNFIS